MTVLRFLRFLIYRGNPCPGCGARPMKPHRIPNCPQRFGEEELWA